MCSRMSLSCRTPYTLSCMPPEEDGKPSLPFIQVCRTDKMDKIVDLVSNLELDNARKVSLQTSTVLSKQAFSRAFKSYGKSNSKTNKI